MPAWVLPALPFLWLQDAFEIGASRRDDVNVRVLYVLIFANPESITVVMPSMVTLVSAMLVATITLVLSGGVSMKIRSCSSLESLPYSGSSISLSRTGLASSMVMQSFIIFSPERNIRMSPSRSSSMQRSTMSPTFRSSSSGFASSGTGS